MFEFSNMGSRIREIREPVLKDGKISVEVIGKEDFQDYINSFADSCDIASIVARSVTEPELLNQRQGSYGDFTEFPKTYAEALQKVIDAKNLFDSLPQSNKDQFGNDVMTFISSLDDPEWPVKAGFVIPKDDTPDVKESAVE